MDESQWDAALQVHLKGHFAPLRHAAAYWKDRTKSGDDVRAAVTGTASISGTLVPNPGQANYGAAKAGSSRWLPRASVGETGSALAVMDGIDATHRD